MGKFDILDSGVPYSMDKTKNYVKLEDGSVEEIVDLSDLETTEVGFIGHKANIHKAELTTRKNNIMVIKDSRTGLQNRTIMQKIVGILKYIWRQINIFDIPQLTRDISSHIHRRIEGGKANWFDKKLCCLLKKLENNHCEKSLGE